MADKIAEARERYQDALDASRKQREQIEEDLAFSDPSNPDQWDPAEKAQRENDPGGSRPCLVLDQLGQYVANVSGQIEQRPPALHALPVDSGADKKVAEHLDGFFRHIEHASRAAQHRSRALTSAARAGVGYLIVRPTVVDGALNYQEPRLDSEGDPLRVVLDPWSVALDGSDADCGWHLTPMGHRAFERQFGKKAEKVSFGDEEAKKVEDEREDILVAEQWIVENATRDMAVFVDSQGGEASLPKDDFEAALAKGERLQFVREYKDKYRCVKWCRMSGAEILVPETIYPASGIGIIPVYGYVGFSGGRMTYCGIPRRARSAQRDFNLHASEFHVYMKLAPRAPWIASARAVKGFEPMWEKASVETRAILLWNDVDENGQPIAPPQRTQVSTNLQNHQAGMDQALRNIQAAIGMYQANLGAPSNETSGVAIESRKQQGEASTANFPFNIAASMTQEGKLYLEMIPRLIDTKRQMRILGFDMTPSSVVVDPEQPQAVVDLPEGGISINPNLGRYDARVVVGQSYSTQRTQAQEAFGEIISRRPELMEALGPVWIDSMDVPNADKAKQAILAIARPEIRAIFSPEGEVPASQLQAENEQLKKALAESGQIAEEMHAEIQQLQAAAEDKSAENEIKQDEVAIKGFDTLVKAIPVLQAQGAQTPQALQALMEQTVQAALASQPEPEPMPDPSETLGPMMQGMGEQMQAQIQTLAQAQAQQAQALAQLIKLVQAPRERIPERGKDGSIQRVIDRLVLEQAEPQGPMQ